MESHPREAFTVGVALSSRVGTVGGDVDNVGGMWGGTILKVETTACPLGMVSRRITPGGTDDG